MNIDTRRPATTEIFSAIQLSEKFLFEKLFFSIAVLQLFPVHFFSKNITEVKKGLLGASTILFEVEASWLQFAT